MQYLLLFFTSFILSYILSCIGMILPWLFGSILAAILLKHYTTIEYSFPKWLGDIGLYLLGAQIGVSFTKEILGDIINEFWSVVFLTVMIICCAIIISRVFRKIINCTSETALLASIPGALNQMIVMAEENPRANLLVVTLAQTSRLLFVIMIVPFISNMTSGHGLHHQKQLPQDMFQVLTLSQIVWLTCMIALMICILKYIHFPVPDMLGPSIVILLWNLTTGLNFTVPLPLIHWAQVLFGIRIGLQMYDLSGQINQRLFIGIVVQNILLLLCAIVLTFILNIFNSHQFNDIFLSAAPGGMAQIVIVALETGANVAMISSYHIFRIFFILLIVAPFMSWYLNGRLKYNE
ncbi:AbrB family transcriptional regulator [Macrococcoides caseolyticum]|uniref:AbrB family transcriptional regulator n=1 Tax=Macrococcoides caseolyticum TaxID=69966 RepID=UPI001F39CA4E|nr:AbrB family transcriptional regulator [Macrococcus caseolyticus]